MYVVELAAGVTIDDDALRALCDRHGIRQLALYGSALRDELHADSDIDLLVDFRPDRLPGLLGIAAIELELAELLGREVDLRTRSDLSRYFRDEVVRTARVLHEAA
jgi:uncharacterized protein